MSANNYDVLLDVLSRKREFTLEELSKELGISESSLAALLEEMRQSGLIEYDKTKTTQYELTERGAEYAIDGLPEARLVNLLKGRGELPVSEASKQLGPEGNAAVSWAVKKGFASIYKREGKSYIKLVREAQPSLDELLKNNPSEAVQRDIAREKVLSRYRILRLSRPAGGKVPYEITKLTHQDIISGRWREAKIKPYDLSKGVRPARGGRKHFFEEFLSWVREILQDMGFQEALGPLIELEFWNYDALFQAQNHPAREMHDAFYLRGRSRVDPALMERVKAEHEAGWGYSWDPLKATSLMLRSQNTAVSARYLYSHAERPIKMYSVDRVFRKDEIDQRHHVEFYQSEGIVVDSGLSLRDLLGFLTEFAKQLGFDEVRFYPSYFPFTEPSVEGYVKHPTLGWLEALPGGVFRPEVTRPLGVKETVIAWGIGISRLAMAKYGLNDIRLLYDPDVDFLVEEGKIADQ